MNSIARLLQHFGFVRHSPYIIYLDRKLFAHLSHLANQQQIPVTELVDNLLKQAVTERYTAVANLKLWEGLTLREKQVAALTSLGCTNHEIAQKMVISTNTVKTHLRHLLTKCDVKSKAELRKVLAGWDFQEWLDAQDMQATPQSPTINSTSPDEVTP